jgi:hypothetical protein
VTQPRDSLSIKPIIICYTYIGLIVERLNCERAEGACSIILDDASWVHAQTTVDLLHKLNQVRRSDQYVRLLMYI